MPNLPNALRAWGSPEFAAVLKAELEGLPSGALPLDRAAPRGGRAADGGVTAMLLRCAGNDAEISAEVGVFFGEILAGCSCGDEPETLDAYCELRVTIDKATAAAAFAPAGD